VLGVVGPLVCTARSASTSIIYNTLGKKMEQIKLIFFKEKKINTDRFSLSINVCKFNTFQYKKHRIIMKL